MNELFTAAYLQYAHMVRCVIRGHINNPDVVQDIAADVWLRTWVHTLRHGFPERPAGWLSVCARHAAIDYCRHLRRHGPEELTPRLPAPHNTEREVERKVEANRIARTMSALTARQQEVLQLRLVDGYTLAETAALMGVAEGTVKSCQFRSTRTLRVLLNESRDS